MQQVTQTNSTKVLSCLRSAPHAPLATPCTVIKQHCSAVVTSNHPDSNSQQVQVVMVQTLSSKVVHIAVKAHNRQVWVHVECSPGGVSCACLEAGDHLTTSVQAAST
jgi:hypothetical protein